MATLPTLTVTRKSDGRRMVINESDFCDDYTTGPAAVAPSDPVDDEDPVDAGEDAGEGESDGPDGDEDGDEDGVEGQCVGHTAVGRRCRGRAMDNGLCRMHGGK